MKILLFGDFSGLHWALKEGLIELGHEVQLASAGDGWKKIPGADINLEGGFPLSALKLAANWGKFKGHDIVQFISPILFSPRLGAKVTQSALTRIRDANDKSFLIVAGGTSIKWSVIDRFRYHPYEDYKKYDLNGRKFWWEYPSFIKWDQTFSESVHGIIPVSCEYQFGYESYPNLKKMIPLPVNLKRFEYQENRVAKRLVVFHGLSRYGFKGTRHIEKAFDALNKKYPNDVECIIKGGLPLNDYLSLMRRVNVVVDQAYSYSSGMNALFAMAMGKVTLGGAEPESLLSLNVSQSPLINILPDSADIEKKIEVLLERRRQMGEMGMISREFVEDNHSHTKIAKMYLDAWAYDN